MGSGEGRSPFKLTGGMIRRPAHSRDGWRASDDPTLRSHLGLPRGHLMTRPLASPGLEATVFLYPDLGSNIPLLPPHSVEVSQGASLLVQWLRLRASTAG